MYANLSQEPHSSIALLNATGHRLAGIGEGSTATPGPAQSVAWQAVAPGGTPILSNGVSEARRVDGPIRAVVVVAVANSDALAAWWVRAGLLGSSVLIIIACLAVAVIAIRRADEREVLRLDRIATFAGELQGQSDRVLLIRRLIEVAQDLVPCQVLPDEEPLPPELPPGRPILLSLIESNLVRIGGVMLRRRRGRCFSATEISCLRALVAVAQSAVYLQDISHHIVIDDKLPQNAKTEAIGRPTRGIAHDFNNLLTVILGNIEILDLELPETGDIRDMHDEIRRAAQTASGLTRQLLALS
jgi:signal transduction histidine kinase